jgi:hypothetical protein
MVDCTTIVGRSVQPGCLTRDRGKVILTIFIQGLRIESGEKGVNVNYQVQGSGKLTVTDYSGQGNDSCR